jgi:hypothetical protein
MNSEENTQALRETFEALKKVFGESISCEFEDTKEQLAKKKPEIFCLLEVRYQDVNLICNVQVCFFTENECIKAREWAEKNAPINKAVGWYEIEKTSLGFIP